MDYNPAKVFGLYGRKGAFELGFDGDIVIVDPEKAWKCEQEKLLTKDMFPASMDWKEKELQYVQ